MGARIYTEAEERRYKLAPLPETPFVGLLASQLLNAQYAAQRAEYRIQYPVRTRNHLETVR